MKSKVLHKQSAFWLKITHVNGQWERTYESLYLSLVCYLASCEDLVTKAGCLDMLFSCWASWRSTRARRHGSSLVTTWIRALSSWRKYIMTVLFYPSMTCHFLLNRIYSKVYRFWLDLAFENGKSNCRALIRSWLAKKEYIVNRTWGGKSHSCWCA